ncbi:antitoxin [Corynebacterium tapiri]|uniref:Antitoxin n=1 Tax=Corynebacterium tapiri TaxID=1448266 RepID=A0A5C4U7D4_9CORY|nr:antitoxin [Corynebacterium tapiri]TNM00478.1 antitoxin [Corynebacterium tapiri]
MNIVTKLVQTISRTLNDPKNAERASGAVDKIGDEAKKRLGPDRAEQVDKVTGAVKDQLNKRR